MYLIPLAGWAAALVSAVMLLARGTTLHDMAGGTRVGLASIKRLLELMYDREGLLVLSNVQPHGAMSQVYIPARPVRERLQMTIQESDL